MNLNNLIVNGKLKLLNNSKLSNSENLNGTAESVLNDENGNKIVKPNIVVPCEQYKELKNINISLDRRNIINNTSFEEKRDPYLLLILNINSKAVIAKILNTNNSLSTSNFRLAEFINLPLSNTQVYCYGNDKAVILPESGNINTAVYSTDGSNWQTSSFPSQHAYSVCYGKDKFVAVTNANNNAYYSGDGINWKTTTIPSSANCYWCSVCYGNDKFVAVGNAGSGNAFAYSKDGINWELGTNVDAGSNNWYSVCYGNGHFIAVHDNSIINTSSSSNTTMAISSDGITWRGINTGITASYDKIIYADNRFYALAYFNDKDRTAFITSKDGYTWKISYYNNLLDSKLIHEIIYAGEHIRDDGTSSHAIYAKSYTYIYSFYFDDDGNCIGWTGIDLKGKAPSDTYSIDGIILLPEK